MTTIPFSGTSRTITDENSVIQNNTFLSHLAGRRSTSSMTTTLEEVIDINQDLEVYNNHQLTLMNPTVLYRTGIFSFNTQLLRINREEEVLAVDMTNNRGIFYCNPDFLISVEDLKHIKIGIQSKGYEEFNGRSNILLNLGFLGRLTDNSTTKFKINTEKIVETMKSKGIEMIKPMEIDPKILSGLEWNLQSMLGEQPSLIPQEGSMYKNDDNSYSIRFSYYVQRNIGDMTEEENNDG